MADTERSVLCVLEYKLGNYRLYKGLLVWIRFLVFFLAFPVSANQETIVVGQTDSVEFRNLFESILKEAGVKYELRIVPTARKRRMFVDGKIQIDCCTAKAWRNLPEEQAVQLHSKVFIHSVEHYFFHEDSDIKIRSPEDLQQYRMAIVRGYVYRNDNLFGEVIGAKDMKEMLRLVSIKRAQVGIINPYDFYKRMKIAPLPLRLGGPHEKSPLTIRVHKSKAELLPRINAVIDRYIAEGKIDEALPDLKFPGQ